MELRDFRTLADSGVIDRVILRRLPYEPFAKYPKDEYELWAFNDDGDWPRDIGNRLKVTRTDKPRTWTSLDRALDVIRQSGWNGTVEVEQPAWIP